MKLTSLKLYSVLFILAAAAVLSSPFLSRTPRNSAVACWTNVLIECFDNDRSGWPWAKPTGANPIRRWRVSPNPTIFLAWGIQDRFYSVGLRSYCSDDIQSCWCIGGPGTEDPEFDNYPANLNTFMTYGPIDLSLATEGRVEFALYFLNAMDVNDSITWGADSVFSLATSHIWIDSTLTQATDLGWRHFSMDLKSLHRNNATHDSVSALGRNEVYVYWWFKSNGNTQLDRGAFVDDVIVSWDDGGLDMLAGGLAVYEPDSITVPTRIETGESVVFQYTWSTCDGGVTNYPEFHVMLAMDGTPVADSTMIGVLPGQTYTWYTEPIEMTTSGDHTLELYVDGQAQVSEVHENNNNASVPFSVEIPNAPPTFEWLSPGVQAPGGDTLFADSQAVLRWSLTDPDDIAWLSFYYDTDTQGCLGPVVPGGLNLTEDSPDSLVWNTNNLINGAVRWPYALYGDNLFSECVYAPFPLVIDRQTAAHEPLPVPASFHLAQNYPNPFNPTTEIEFGLTRGGHTTLTVYDISGREVAKLIDNELTPGVYQSNFDAGERPSGVYVYRLDAPEGSIARKMILMK